MTMIPDDELEGGELCKKITLQQLHERGGVRVHIVRSSGVEVGVT